MIFFVERLHDCLKKKTCVIVCMERLHDFSHSLNHSGCLIYFFLEVAWFSFAERLCDLFVEIFAWFFVWRGCLIFIVKRLHNFCLMRFLVIKKVFWCKKFFCVIFIVNIFFVWFFFCKIFVWQKKFGNIVLWILFC